MTTKTPLENHEEICAIRYKGIEDKLERLINEVGNLKQELTLGKGAVKAVFWIGAAIALLATVLKLSGKGGL